MVEPKESLALIVNAASFSGWSSIRVSRSIENATGNFTLGVTHLPDGLGRVPAWRGFEACCVKLNGEAIITGFLETIAETIDGHKHTIEISGRERHRAAAIIIFLGYYAKSPPANATAQPRAERSVISETRTKSPPATRRRRGDGF